MRAWADFGLWVQGPDALSGGRGTGLRSLPLAAGGLGEVFVPRMSHGVRRARHGVRANERKLTMTAKLDLLAAAPALMKDWMATSLAVNASLDHSLIELVKIRASQINGCANCINMHTAEARAQGETEQRLYLLSAWREAPCYSDRERAALAWTEALTRIVAKATRHEAAYEALKAHFTEEEQVKLTLVINVINGWNRLAVGFGAVVRAGRRESRRRDGRLTARPTSGRSGGLRSAAAEADARRLPHARLGRRCRGRGAGGLHPLDAGRPRRGARARGVPAPHGHAALPRPAQIGAAPARDLRRPLAARAGGRGGRGARTSPCR